MRSGSPPKFFRANAVLPERSDRTARGLHFRRQDHLPLEVVVDEQLFQEVVMNLLLNSYDAVGQQGNISITAGKGNDSTVFLSVKDDGNRNPAGRPRKDF
jgi:signal transduction histidine kinase